MKEQACQGGNLDFTCPHCGKKIENSKLSKHLGSLGGKRSKRKLSSQDARAMAQKSAKARAKKRLEE